MVPWPSQLFTSTFTLQKNSEGDQMQGTGEGHLNSKPTLAALASDEWGKVHCTSSIDMLTTQLLRSPQNVQSWATILVFSSKADHSFVRDTTHAQSSWISINLFPSAAIIWENGHEITK
ncbi:hypothetical protein Ancab_023946 [Ancistrocladus abbreviatus]